MRVFKIKVIFRKEKSLNAEEFFCLMEYPAP